MPAHFPVNCGMHSGRRACLRKIDEIHSIQAGKNFCLTKPDSALLSGEELNSCSHCERFLGLSAVITTKLILRMPRQAIVQQPARREHSISTHSRRAGDFFPACLNGFSFDIVASRAGLPSFLSLTPNDYLNGNINERLHARELNLTEARNNRVKIRNEASCTT